MSEGEHGEYVTYREYMTAHMVLEKQVAVNNQQIVELMSGFKDIKQVADDTNKKITDHILSEDKTWADIRSDLTNIKDHISHPSVGTRTLFVVIGLIIAAIEAAHWYFR